MCFVVLPLHAKRGIVMVSVKQVEVGAVLGVTLNGIFSDQKALTGNLLPRSSITSKEEIPLFSPGYYG